MLVDTQPGRPNNSLPDGVGPTAVIDHHPAYGTYPGVPFLDLREQYGATSTIVTEYVRESKLTPEPKIATALFYGITAETQDLGRESTAADIEAAHFLYPYANNDARRRETRASRGYSRGSAMDRQATLYDRASCDSGRGAVSGHGRRGRGLPARWIRRVGGGHRHSRVAALLPGRRLRREVNAGDILQRVLGSRFRRPTRPATSRSATIPRA